MFNVDAAVDSAANNISSSTYGIGQCAKFTANAIRQGGLPALPKLPAGSDSATNYADKLISVGFENKGQLQRANWLKGDVAIIKGVTGHPHGHMCIYNGTNWISDFVQERLYPSRSYGEAPYNIYRYTGAAYIVNRVGLNRV